MEDYDIEDEDVDSEVTEQEEDLDLDDEFEKLNADSEDGEECIECGIAIVDNKKVVREINGETYIFCSEECTKEFEDSLGE